MSNLTGVIGLARRAGKLKFGSEQTVESIRSFRKPSMVCLASDASCNTVKRITNGCQTHHVRLEVLPISKDEMGRCIGKTMDVSVVALMDDHFCRAVDKQLELLNASGETESAGGVIHGSNED